ncbi:MAG: class I SAM-dependent methyltransferase [Planctomycetota bacterium]
MTRITGCRSSGDATLETILDFGESPLADQLLDTSELSGEDPKFPLELVFAPSSTLVQITEDVPPEILYRGDYPYYTSVSPGLVDHFTKGAHQIMERKELDASSLVVEAASNDGYQLRVFKERGIGVLGVDPASGPAKAAEDAGVDTICDFFSADVAGSIASRGKRADVVTGNNVLNLVQDLADFTRAVDEVLAPDGLVVLEVPYLVDTIDKCAFDNVFHQNTTYWTATSLSRHFARHGLHLNDAVRIPTFGGSLRVYLGRSPDPSPAVQALLAEEHERGVDTFAFYAAFADRVAAIKAELTEMIRDIRARGDRIVAYGAAGGMATTLLSYLDLDDSTLDYAVDINPHKHGRYTSGSRLLIHPAERLAEDRPDYALLLAWNFADEIMRQQSAYTDAGGRFIVPVPQPRIA